MGATPPSLLQRFRRSFAAKLVVLLIIFAVVPALVYGLLMRADGERNALVLRVVQEEGRLIAEAVFPYLDAFTPATSERLTEMLPRLASEGTAVKVLFRPEGEPNPSAFFFVASTPQLEREQLEEERREIIDTGLLTRFRESCGSGGSLAVRYVTAAGAPQVLTHIRSHLAENGCWVVLTARAPNEYLASSLEENYWKTTTIQIAAAIYLVMAVLVFSIFFDAWANLRRFRTTAREIRGGRDGGASFAARNRVPELDSVAEEFDDLVATLRRSERLIRQAAEENAHAFKAPLAVISQALEPIRNALPLDDRRAERSLRLIEQSVERLDALISAARKIEEATAEIMDRPLVTLDLTQLLGNLTLAFAPLAEERGVDLKLELAPGLRVTGNPELIETAVENLLENALDFTPRGAQLLLSARPDQRDAVIEVADEGPGVPREDLERIFERYVSIRSGESAGSANFGIGLWIVRRNLEAMGGSVSAKRRPEGGLTVEMRLPLVT
jgi:two-component system sensor histidine kinase ChvG